MAGADPSRAEALGNYLRVTVDIVPGLHIHGTTEAWQRRLLSRTFYWTTDGSGGRTAAWPTPLWDFATGQAKLRRIASIWDTRAVLDAQWIGPHTRVAVRESWESDLLDVDDIRADIIAKTAALSIPLLKDEVRPIREDDYSYDWAAHVSLAEMGELRPGEWGEYLEERLAQGPVYYDRDAVLSRIDGMSLESVAPTTPGARSAKGRATTADRLLANGKSVAAGYRAKLVQNIVRDIPFHGESYAYVRNQLRCLCGPGLLPVLHELGLLDLATRSVTEAGADFCGRGSMTYLRSTVEQRVAEMTRRATTLNASADVKVTVKTLIVFGSYLGDAERIGDVDVCAEIVPRGEMTVRQYHDGARSAAAEMRGNSPLLRIHDLSSLREELLSRMHLILIENGETLPVHRVVQPREVEPRNADQGVVLQ
jgi:hypothetical protein